MLGIWVYLRFLVFGRVAPQSRVNTRYAPTTLGAHLPIATVSPHLIPSHPIPNHPAPSRPISSHPIPYPIPYHPTRSHLNLVSPHPLSHIPFHPMYLESNNKPVPALSGDFCTDPDTNVETLIAESSDDETLRSLLTYYTGDCTSENFAIDAIIAAQETAIPAIQEALTLLNSFSVSYRIESLDTSKYRQYLCQYYVVSKVSISQNVDSILYRMYIKISAVYYIVSKVSMYKDIELRYIVSNVSIYQHIELLYIVSNVSIYQDIELRYIVSNVSMYQDILTSICHIERFDIPTYRTSIYRIESSGVSRRRSSISRIESFDIPGIKIPKF